MDKHDIEKTMVFKPIKDEKPIVNRAEAPIYNDDYENDYEEEDYAEYEEYEEDEKNKKFLIYTLFILAIILVIAITVAIVVFSGGDKDSSNKSDNGHQDDNIIVNGDYENEEEEDQKDEESEEESAEKENEVSFYYISFYRSSAIKENDGYSIAAKLYDESMMVEGNKNLYLTEGTKIRINNERWNDEDLIELLQSEEGNELVFEAEIIGKTGEVISISYEGELNEENSSEEISPEEETETEEESAENSEEETNVPKEEPSEENQEGKQGISLD